MVYRSDRGGKWGLPNIDSMYVAWSINAECAVVDTSVAYSCSSSLSIEVWWGFRGSLSGQIGPSLGRLGVRVTTGDNVSGRGGSARMRRPEVVSDEEGGDSGEAAVGTGGKSRSYIDTGM